MAEPAIDEEPPFDDEPPSAAPPRRRGPVGGRIPPHNEDAERALIGTLLLSRDAVADAAEVLPGAMVFYRPAHAHIYEAIMVLTARGDAVDPITVAEELGRRGLLDNAGGMGNLIDLHADAPGTANATFYARIIRDHYYLRRMIQVAAHGAEIAYGLPTDVKKALDEFEVAALDIADDERTMTTVHLSQTLSDTLTHIEALAERDGSITGTTTGFIDLDHITAGLQPGQLVVVGARPAMGKTSFALNMAVSAAKAGETVVVFSLEMTSLELTMRVLGAEAKVNAKKFRDGQGLNDADWNGIALAMGRLGDLNLYWDDGTDITIMDIRNKARRLKREHGRLGMIVIDYIQLMTGRSTAESRQVEVAEISRGLKLLAREVQCPVVALAQLNRGLEQRADKRPMLSDLRESGSLEQDADIVMFLYRDEIYEPTPDNQGLAEVIIAKQRNGPTGVVRLSFLAHLTKFENMARDDA